MQATVHAIEGRLRTGTNFMARVGDFKLGAPQTVRAELVVDEPGWSLYCLDHDARTALFVEIPPGVDLAAAAFTYLRQYEVAERALLVPFDALAGLAVQIPPPPRVAFIFSIGRCGTTLASHILTRAGAWCLSEPDVYFSLSMNRARYGHDEMRGLIDACTRLLYRPPAGRAVETFGIKFRCQCLADAAHFHAAFPDAAFVFMYRDALSWGNSFFRFMQKQGFPSLLEGDKRQRAWNILSSGADPSYIVPYVDLSAEKVPAEMIQAVAWAFNMETYLKLLDAGVPFLATRYNDLNGNREATTAALLAHCGLPMSALPAGLAVFDRDSQEDTGIGRDNKFAGYGDAETARFLATLAKQPRFNAPDARVPDIRRASLV